MDLQLQILYNDKLEKYKVKYFQDSLFKMSVI